MAAVTLAYSVFTFANLGTRKAPETDWISSEAGETVTFDLGSAESFTFTYYGGICNCTFDVSISQDGSEFTVTPKNTDNGNATIFAVYKDGEMKYIHIDDKSFNVTVSVPYDNVKALLWNSIESLEPITPAKIK